MRDYRVYVCDKCGEEFSNDREKCHEHEISHIKPDNYSLWDSGSYQPDSKYPAFIKIPMADGAEVMYKYDAILPTEEKNSPLLQTED
jgi:hypothetical protein